MNEPKSLTRWAPFLLHCPKKLPIISLGRSHLHQDRLHLPPSRASRNQGSDIQHRISVRIRHGSEGGIRCVPDEGLQAPSQRSATPIRAEVEASFQAGILPRTIVLHQSAHAYRDRLQCRHIGLRRYRGRSEAEFFGNIGPVVLTQCCRGRRTSPRRAIGRLKGQARQ